MRRLLLLTAVIVLGGSPTPASAAGGVELARLGGAQTSPVIGDRGFVVQASEIWSLTLVDEPRSRPVGAWIECAYFAVAAFDASIEVIGTPLVPHAGAAYSLWCWHEPDHALVPGHPVIVLFDPLDPVPGLVDVIDVAEFAQRQLDFEPPVPVLSPAAGQVVGVETWLAVTSELDYPDVTAQAGRAWATVRTTFRDAVWDLGEGSSLTCTSDAATTWDPGRGADKSSRCTHTYIRSSTGVGFPATVTVTWALEWKNNRAPDRFVPWTTLSLTTPLLVEVDQLQAVIR